MSGRRERLRPYRELRRRYRPDRRAFERLVAEALEALPADFRDKLSNVAVVVAERPSSAEGEAVGRDLLGLYRGIPYGQRGVGYHLVPPDRITIYREPILAACRTPAEVREEVRKTVLHEIGHYFGLSEADLP
jgi:predicted Zn-dependent protease with MMP-like domain